MRHFKIIHGNNVLYDLYLSFPDAALGTSIEVPTITGKVKITVPAGTQSGKVMRLRGKGIKDINGYGTGDQLVHINVWTPRTLSKDEKEMLEHKAQLDILEHLSVYINNLRESLTRELIVNDVKSDEELEEKLKKIKIEQQENHIDLGLG